LEKNLVFTSEILSQIKNFRQEHRLYPVKTFMQRFKSDIELTCSFCLNSDETMIHLFWSCHYTQKLWNDIDVLIKSKI